MGNTPNACCSCRRGTPDRSEATCTALETIKAAQRKYFNSHIEGCSDESGDEVSRDESIDYACFGSEMSLDTLDDGSSVHDVTGMELGPTNNLLHSVLVNGANNRQQQPLLQQQTLPQSNGGSRGTSPERALKKKVLKRKPKAKFIRLNKRENFFSILNHEDKRARSVDPRIYDYPFENIVFEGGGNKGLAYCGAVRLMEELELWPRIKRLAGTSAGAMTAALLAVGYNSHDLQEFFSLNLNKIFLDHKFGYLSLLPNLIRSYGWNPGEKINKWIGQKMEEKTGDMDITFNKLYQLHGKELCIVVTNLNQMTSLYCHPKTTPNMPIRLAVRMSISIPGMFQAVRHTLHGHNDIFVDGGVLCNYPVHCFDGWWLSMKPEDNFLERLQPLEDISRLLERSERFGSYNHKTLGMQLYSDNETDLLKYQLENLRHGTQLQELPNTKLAREKLKKKKLQLKTDREHRRLVKAMNAFLLTLRKHNENKDENIDRLELEAALNDSESFPSKKRQILFGDVGSDVILDYLDRDHNGKICYNELVHFMEETGISMQNRFLGYQRRPINTLPMFLDTLQATLLTNVKKVYVEERDLKRTVGINTGHIGTSDFVLEPEDIEFVIERGRRSLEAFLKYYVACNDVPKKPEFQKHDKNHRKSSQVSGSSSLNDTHAPATHDTSPIPRSRSNSPGKESSDIIQSSKVESLESTPDECIPNRMEKTILNEKESNFDSSNGIQSIGATPVNKAVIFQHRNIKSNDFKNYSRRAVSISDKVKIIDMQDNNGLDDGDDDDDESSNDSVKGCDVSSPSHILCAKDALLSSDGDGIVKTESSVLAGRDLDVEFETAENENDSVAVPLLKLE